MAPDIEPTPCTNVAGRRVRHAIAEGQRQDLSAAAGRVVSEHGPAGSARSRAGDQGGRWGLHDRGRRLAFASAGRSEPSAVGPSMPPGVAAGHLSLRRGLTRCRWRPWSWNAGRRRTARTGSLGRTRRAGASSSMASMGVACPAAAAGSNMAELARGGLHALFGEAVIFSADALMPMRAIPCIVCLPGMNDGEYPRVRIAHGFRPYGLRLSAWKDRTAARGRPLSVPEVFAVGARPPAGFWCRSVRDNIGRGRGSVPARQRLPRLPSAPAKMYPASPTSTEGGRGVVVARTLRPTQETSRRSRADSKASRNR